MEFGYVSIHDPTTGEWHHLPKDALEWAKWEAGKRKELYRGGYRKAYRLTSQEMEEIRSNETTPIWEQPSPGCKAGLVYDDDET